MRIVADVAGSLPTRSSTSGVIVPKKPAMTRFRAIDTSRTTPSSGLWSNTVAIAATSTLMMEPFAAPAITSLRTARPPADSDYHRASR